MTAAPALKYRFEAHFADGSIYQQTAEDRSNLEPEKRSAFYDLCVHGENGESLLDEDGYCVTRSDIVLFGIFSDEHWFSVDLRDGHFAVDGVMFSAQPIVSPSEVQGGGTFRLVYYRDREEKIRNTYRDGSVESEPVSSEIKAYRFGWVYTAPDGKKFRQTIAVG